LPDTEPEYVMAAEPTVPKLMAVPCTVPLMPVMLGLEFAFESLIVPLNRGPDCFQCRVNVPWYAPPYVPDHVPESESRVARTFATEAPAAGELAALALE
jgi:hypothetical protein